LSLRRQLLIVALLLLSLPWAGCQFIQEMEGALREGQANTLQATAEAVAAVISQRPELIYTTADRRGKIPDTRRLVYARPTDKTVIVDGYDDGWENLPHQRFSAPDGATIVEVMAQTRGTKLYLLLRVKDEELIYHNPGLSAEANGDRLVLRLWRAGKRQDFVIATAAPGKVRARWFSKRTPGLDASRIRGYWQDAVGGYSLELELPLAYTGERLGFYVINERVLRGRKSDFVGNVSRGDSSPPPWLIFSPAPLQKLLASFARPGGEIQILDDQQWLVGQVQSMPDETPSQPDTFWLLKSLYRSILDNKDLSTPPGSPETGKRSAPEIDSALRGILANHRYRDSNYSSRTLLSSAAPIRDSRGIMGAVLVRQSSETYLSLTDQAFSRLLAYSLLALGVGVLTLLGFASLLSWRIRRLSLAASSAIEDDGGVRQGFPRSKAADEIGDLSRHYADLLERVRRYNDYLRTLSRKLSHELRTPIAVIQSSLDNMQQERSAEGESDKYLVRAKDGLARLQQILTAMSEASALEESIQSQPLQRVALNPLLTEVIQAYREIYPGRQFTLSLPPNNAIVKAAPELLVQALDKLVDNAASFCPQGGRINLALASHDKDWRLRLFNEGPALPAHLGSSLLEAMVSERSVGDDGVHLGLGLHVVRLIAEYHRGAISIADAPEGNGVVATLSLPMADAEAG
jgi:two-component system sensor histidine kinase ChvG